MIDETTVDNAEPAASQSGDGQPTVGIGTGDATPSSMGDVFANLKERLSALAETEAEASGDSSTEAEEADEEEKVIDNSKEEEGKDAETDQDKADDAESDEDSETDDDTEADGEVIFLTADELREKFPRNASKELLGLTAQYSDIARESREKLESLGGEPFIEPLAKMSGAIQSALEGDDPYAATVDFFSGVMDMGGSRAFGGLLGDATSLALVIAPEWAKVPATAEWGQAILEHTDNVLEMRFGLNSRQIEQAAEFQQIGLFEKIAEWSKAYAEDGYIDETEVEGLLAALNDPKAKALAQENARLKAELEAKQEAALKEAKTPAADATQIEAFENFVGDRTQTICDKVLWNRSILGAKTGDESEVAEFKQFLRESAEQQILNAFASSRYRSEIEQAFARNQTNTAIFQQNLSRAFDYAIKTAKPSIELAEQMIAKLHGNTRNAMLAKAKTQAAAAANGTSSKTNDPLTQTRQTPAQPKTPTVTTPLEDTSEKPVESMDDVYTRLKQRLNNL